MKAKYGRNCYIQMSYKVKIKLMSIHISNSRSVYCILELHFKTKLSKIRDDKAYVVKLQY